MGTLAAAAGGVAAPSATSGALQEAPNQVLSCPSQLFPNQPSQGPEDLKGGSLRAVNLSVGLNVPAKTLG